MQKVAFLDRDGVIIEDMGYPKEARFLPGAEELLKSLHSAGYRIAIVTNQSGVARGILQKKDVERVNKAVYDFVRENTGQDVPILYAPDHPKFPTRRRKPETGMFEEVLELLEIRNPLRTKCICIGDKDSDIIAGKLFGCFTIKVGSVGFANPDFSIQAPCAIPKNVLHAVPERERLLHDPERMFEAESEYLVHVVLTTAKYWKTEILTAAGIISKAIKTGKAVLVLGNGGSAADGDHFVGELIGRFKKERKGLPALSGTLSTAALTAIANDYGYEEVFTRIVESFANSLGACILISTSGESENVIRAAQLCKRLGIPTVGLLGKGGGRCAKICDIPIIVPSWSTPHIQEVHKRILHFIAEVVERDCTGL